MIETERLILRPYDMSDLADYMTMVSDPAVMQHLGVPPMLSEDAWNRLLRYAGHWHHFKFGMFAVFERTTNRFLGETGVADFHRGLGKAFEGAGEAAWVFRPEAQGRGFAFEAASAAIR